MALPKVIAVVGRIGAGKDVICDYLVTKYHGTKRGFSDPLYQILDIINPAIPVGESLVTQKFKYYKDLVAEYGQDRAKRMFPEIRRLLQVIGTECGRNIHGPQCWTNAMARASASDHLTCVRDCRFPSEVDWVRSQDSLIIHVHSAWEQAPTAHISDFAIDAKACADYSIENNGTLEALYDKVEGVLDQWAQHHPASKRVIHDI